MSNSLKGPNFSEGVSVDEFKINNKLLGHFDGAQVLMVKQENKFYAISNSCSHYGGPLSDGLVIGYEAKCPWHHAGFDIRTGEVSCAPGVKAINAYKTEVRGDKVFVTEKMKKEATKRDKLVDKHFLIIGGGAATEACVSELRRSGFGGKITVVSKDSALPYDRPNLSKGFLTGAAKESWLPLRSDTYYEKLEVNFLLNSEVVHLDEKKKEVHLKSGETISFDKCLIATGGEPFVPPLKGIDLPHVYFLRTLNDSKKIAEKLANVKKAVIIGAGFIGLEAASSLRSKDIEVTVVALNKMPLSNVVGDEASMFLKKYHEKNGVNFKLSSSVKEIKNDSVELTSGEVIGADLVIVGTGVKPAIDFLKDSPLKGYNGVEVNEYLETNTKDIFAAGDIAIFPYHVTNEKVRIEHWALAQAHGMNAAKNMLGLNIPFRTTPFFWTRQFDTSICYVGHASKYDEVKVYGDIEKKDACVSFSKDGTILAVMTFGRSHQSLKIEHAFETNDQEAIKKILNA